MFHIVIKINNKRYDEGIIQVNYSLQFTLSLVSCSGFDFI